MGRGGVGGDSRNILLGGKPRTLDSRIIKTRDIFDYRQRFTDEQKYHGWRYHIKGEPVEGWLGTGSYSIRTSVLTSAAEQGISLDREPVYFDHDPLNPEDLDIGLDEFPFYSFAEFREFDPVRDKSSSYWFKISCPEINYLCNLSVDEISMIEKSIRGDDNRRWMFLESPETYDGTSSYKPRAVDGPALFYYNLDKQRVDAAVTIGDMLYVVPSEEQLDVADKELRS